MNFKTTYVLFGLLAGMFLVLAVVLYRGPGKRADAEYVFPGMHTIDNKVEAKSIDKVVIQRKVPSASDIVFERVDEHTWKMTEPRQLPADSGVINNLVDSIISAKFDEENAPASVKAGGLDNPTRIITLKSGDKEWKLVVGGVTPGEEHGLVYVLAEPDNKDRPMAVSKSTLDSALQDLNYFRSKNLLGSDSREIRSIKLSQGKKGPVVLTKEGDNWKLTQPPYGTADASNIVNSVTGLNIEHKSDKESDFVADSVTDLAKYNLDPAKADVLRVTVTRGEKGKETTSTALIGVSKKEGDKYYATLDTGDKKDVVKVPVTNVEPLVKLVDDPGSLRSKNLLALESFKQPDAIDIVNSYGTLEFRKPETDKPWELYRGKDQSKVDENEVRKLIDELNKKDVITSFPDAAKKKELGLEKEPADVTVTVYSDSLEKPDAKKPGKPAWKKGVKAVTVLRFGNRVGENVAVERIWGDEKTLAMVPGSVLDQVRKGPLAYMDRTLPPYNPGSAEEDVTKVELYRPGETFELTRESNTAPWKFAKPDALKGRDAGSQAVRDILGEMNRLTAREIVVEKADAKDLAGTYDLAKPPYRVVVTVTKDKKPKAHEFLFGKEVAGKGVYMKFGDKDTIYLVGPEVLTTLKQELRDRVVFNFDPDKVTTFTVKGWSKLVGEVTTRSFEQKDGKWTATKPAGLNFDANKVTGLLNTLSHLQAEKFVSGGKGLKLEEDAIGFEVTLPDKKVLELTVGGEDGNYYYATSNQLKGDVFQVQKSAFEEVRKAPSYFNK